MDGQWAIERNRMALKAILAGLVDLARLAERPTTLPRRLHRAVLRLLRPAESAARRLIIALAHHLAGASAQFQAGTADATKPSLRAGRATRGRLALPLFDRLRRPARRSIPLRDLPRICVPGYTDRRPVPVWIPPSPFDPIDATRLSLRLDALARALDDLPAQAKRFARWQSRQISSKARKTRLWPLRLGPPPGRRTSNSRRPAHEVDDVLASSHELAMEALEQPHPS